MMRHQNDSRIRKISPCFRTDSCYCCRMTTQQRLRNYSKHHRPKANVETDHHTDDGPERFQISSPVASYGTYQPESCRYSFKFCNEKTSIYKLPNISSIQTKNSRSFSVLISELFLQFTCIYLILFTSPTTSQVNNYAMTTAQQNKISGQFSISQLCGSRSQFPVTRRIEGGSLSSSYQDTDINCTVIFRTKSAQQHFVIRFEELKLGCDDHLVMFDGDMDYGQTSIKDFSCRDNMASVPILKTTGTFLTMRYSTDNNAKIGDGFRLIVTAVFDGSMSSGECPPEYTFCRNHLCISRSLFCDGLNHCLDNSDELGCDDSANRNDISYALYLLVALVLIILVCVSFVMAVTYCRRDHHPYAQYQHHLQRSLGVPLQTSSSLMFSAHQPQYQFFQPANMSPYITPQHHALATLPRGFSTLPLNMTPTRPPQRLVKANNINSNHIQSTETAIGPNEYLMMTAFPGPQPAALQHPIGAPALQANFVLPSSQSILTPLRYAQTPLHQRQPLLQQQLHHQQQQQQQQQQQLQQQQQQNPR